MKLWLFSSGDLDSNRAVDPLTFGSIKKNKLRVAFVSAGDAPQSYYYEFKKRISYYIHAEFKHYNPLRAKDWTLRECEKLLSSDLIYFSGGNTFDLFSGLEKQNILLKNKSLFNCEGGNQILAGHSAGAIVISQSLVTASYPSWDRDENNTHIADKGNAMGLFPGVIFPHYEDDKRLEKSLKRLSQGHLSNMPLYVIPDGGCIKYDCLSRKSQLLAGARLF